MGDSRVREVTAYRSQMLLSLALGWAEADGLLVQCIPKDAASDPGGCRIAVKETTGRAR